MFSATKGGSPSGYQISRSVRLRSSASAYFQRTITTTGSATTITFSSWVKRGRLGARQTILSNKISTSGINALNIEFTSSDTLAVANGTTADVASTATSTAVFRDPSAWYHFVVVIDTTLASGRVKAWVNNQQVISADPMAQNATLRLSNNSYPHTIGQDPRDATYYDGYLTEINFIDGQALTPSSFGSTNATTGVWQPIKYTGTYGTNGFYLNFSDNSAATAAAIGKDYSGNGNNWTPNNISVTAGVTYDSMLDVPTQWADGGNGRGNYCVLNPLIISGLSGGATLSNGNLRVSGTNGVSNAYARGTMALSGKFYAEFFFDVVNATATIGVDAVNATSGALATSSTSVSYRSGGNKRVLGTESAYGASWVANDIIGVAVDTAANTVEFFKNGVSQGVITSSAFFAQGDCVFAMAKDDIGSPLGYANFGQRPFAYTPPTGFKALNTLNLPTPTILKGNQFFDAVTYAGSASQQTITTALTGLDFAWIKNRTTARDHVLVDTVRGGSPLLTLYSDLTAAEDNTSPNYNPTSFTTSGIVLGGAKLGINNAGENFVLWGWKEGATQGFDIVTFTGNGTARTIAHNLGVAPNMIIVKARNLPNSIARSWAVWHSALSATEVIFLNQTSAKQTGATTYWNSTLPTSSVFSLGTEPTVNGATGTVGEYVAYLFAAVAGYSAFGSYTGNGSADGPFVFCGFRPRFVLIKCSSAAGTGWYVYDTVRNTYNVMDLYLRPDVSDAETTFTTLDCLSNGFKLRTSNSQFNGSGSTYIFAAFAENPFKNALAR